MIAKWLRYIAMAMLSMMVMLIPSVLFHRGIVSEMAMQGMQMRLIYGVMFVFAAWLILRLLDALSGIDFRETIKEVTRDPIAAAVYYGMRFFGVILGLSILIS